MRTAASNGGGGGRSGCPDGLGGCNAAGQGDGQRADEGVARPTASTALTGNPGIVTVLTAGPARTAPRGPAGTTLTGISVPKLAGTPIAAVLAEAP